VDGLIAGRCYDSPTVDAGEIRAHRGRRLGTIDLWLIGVAWLFGCAGLALTLLVPPMSYVSSNRVTDHQHYENGVHSIALALVSVGLAGLAAIVAFATRRMALCVALVIVTLLLCVPAAWLDHAGTRLRHQYGPQAPAPRRPRTESALNPPGALRQITTSRSCRRLCHAFAAASEPGPARSGLSGTYDNGPWSASPLLRGLFASLWRVEGSNLRSSRDRFTVCSL
jgi:hypothetical protein